MAQQTAMQEAIEYLKLFNLEASAIILEDKFLEKEKGQIAEAYEIGVEDSVHNNPLKTGNEYYRETFNK